MSFDIAPILAATAPDVVTFVVGAIMTLGGAVAVVAMRNPVHAALSLVVTLFGVAILFVAQEAHFMAAVQVIVYAGAIVILFLFVIMLLGVDRVEPLKRERVKAQRPLAILFSLALVGAILALAQLGWEATGASSQGGPLSGPGTDVEKIADSIFTDYLFPFEATALLLVIAVVGAVVMARRQPDAIDDDVDPADGDPVDDDQANGSDSEVTEEPSASDASDDSSEVKS